MLSINAYTQEYVDSCRANVERTVAAYESIVTAARAGEGNDAVPLEPAIEAFEPSFYNHMVLALDGYFGHRSRNMELKDGNPLNEVRILCSSIMHNGSRLAADKSIRLKPETSILKLQVGDEIALNGADFSRLSRAFLAEIESKYP